MLNMVRQATCELRLRRRQSGEWPLERPQRHLGHPPERNEDSAERDNSDRQGNAQLPVWTRLSANRLEHEVPGTDYVARHACSATYFCCFVASPPGRMKYCHLSMPAGKATSKNPTIISSEV